MNAEGGLEVRGHRKTGEEESQWSDRIDDQVANVYSQEVLTPNAGLWGFEPDFQPHGLWHTGK